MSSDAAPNRRKPATRFWISYISRRDRSWSPRPICGRPQATTQSLSLRRPATRSRWSLRKAPFPGAPFLADEAVTRPGLGQVLVQHLLGALVGQADEIGRPLQRHLKVLDL